MKKTASSSSLLSIVALLAASGPVHAVNRFVISNQTLTLGSTANLVPVRADVDQDIFGFSVHIQYDASKVNVTAVQEGTSISGIDPEYFQGTITNSPGRIVQGVVFDTTEPTITKKLSPGTNLEVLELSVNVVAAAATTVVLDLVNVPGNPSRLNVMTNSNGDSVSPAPTLVDGTLTLSSGGGSPPVITSLADNTGTAGTEFLVGGQNFTVPGLAVTVCDLPATAVLLPDNQTIRVTAPDCAIVGWAVIVVSTSAGSDQEAQGFFYGSGGTQFQRGDADGSNQVEITDAVRVLNVLFLGIGSISCQDAADADDSGGVEITDAVRILNVLFLGIGSIPAPGMEDCGDDPTVDDLEACVYTCG
jgi:hypothetical protein